MLHLEAGRPRIEDLGPHDVRRQHVRRELDAVETGMHQLGQRFERQRLGQPWNPLQQDVAPHQQHRDQAVHQFVLPDQIAPDLRPQRAYPPRCSHDFLVAHSRAGRGTPWFDVQTHESSRS